MQRYPKVEHSDDELDFLSGATSPTSTLVGSASRSGISTPLSSLEEAGPSKGAPMSLRKRPAKIIEVMKPKGNVKTAENMKRKRTQSEPNQEAAKGAKRTKLEHRVALTADLNKRKLRVESARKHWLYKHRELFEPLLPDTSNFFSVLGKELKGSSDSGSYVPLHELDAQPRLVKGGEMKDYQLHGLSFLVWMYSNGMNCILGDEMGLGKTLQTLSLFAYIAEHESPRPVNPHLVLCPLSVLSAWIAEAQRWVPSLKTLRFHGVTAERTRLKELIRSGDIEFDICVATYESYAADVSWFKSKQWTYIVLDEGHKIKNSETQIAHKLQGNTSLYKLILTGTPVQNNLVELWGLLHWLYPKIFTLPSERLFSDSFDLSHGSYSTNILTAANKLLGIIVLRRTKAVVDCTVPPKEELTVFMPMTEAQRFWTLGLLTRLEVSELEKIFDSEVKKEEGSSPYIAQMKQTARQGLYRRLQNLVLQLRMVCDHPYLLPDAEPTPFFLGEHIVASSTKLAFVDKLLADLLPKGDRVLIFSQWTSMLDLLEDFMNLRGIPYARLDGSTSRPRRTLDIKLFQREDSPYKVFLISTKAGGLGINLTKASHVVLFDSDWNPQNDIQAIGRAHRIGQTKPVKVYRLVCQGSVEDQMLDRLRRKLFLSVKIMGSSNASSDPSNDPEASSSSIRELMAILKRGSSSLMQGGAGGMTLRDFLKADFETIVNTSRDRDTVRVIKMEADLSGSDAVKVEQGIRRQWEEEEQALLAGVAQVQSRLFEGKLVQRAKDANNGPATGLLKGLGPSIASSGPLSSLKVNQASKENRAMADAWREVQRQAGAGSHHGTMTVNGLEMDMAFVGEITETQPKPVQKPKRKQYEHEDWCIHCRDGGPLVCCSHCPRVFHAKCRGLSKAAVQKMLLAVCTQHACVSCNRGTQDSGGMLFRCQTCPQAFCEDCLSFDDIVPVGPTIPEYTLCSYSAQGNAYYIRCQDCLELFKEEPQIWEGWLQEWEEIEEKIRVMQALNEADL